MNQENFDETRNFEEKLQPSISPVNLLEQLPFITESFVAATCKSQPKRDLDIVKKRFGLNHESFYSLEEIGIYYSITRERVRQIESEIIKKLSELMCGSSESKKFKIQESIVQDYKQIKNDLLDLDYILTEEEIVKFFQDRYGISKESDSLFSLNFLMELLGYSG